MPLTVVMLLIAMSLTIFLSPAIGVPLLVLAGIIGAIGWFRGNSTATARMENLRDEANTGVEFTPRDQATLTPTEHR